jgi:hypothetical protein
MLSDARMSAGRARIDPSTKKIRPDDVRKMVTSLRILLGPLEKKYDFKLYDLITALNDTSDVEEKAAQMAACLLALMDEDFDVDTLDTELVSNANDQRRIFQIYALGLIAEIPEELMDPEAYRKYSSNVTTTQHKIRYVA